MPTFVLEKQTRLQWKQTCFILTLPVAGAVMHDASRELVAMTSAKLSQYPGPHIYTLLTV